MKTKVLFFCLSTASIALFAACSGGSYGFNYSSLNKGLVVDTSATDPSISDGGSTIVGSGDGGTVSTDQPFGGTTPSAPPSTSGGGSSTDNDGDGIPNDTDHLPNVCTSLLVTSHGTSSAKVYLNGELIFAPADFHNESEITLTKNVNLLEGSNALSVSIAGSPGDQLLVQIYNCSKEPSVLLFETTVTRAAGAPNSSGGSF